MLKTVLFVLYALMTRVGICTFSMTFAMVKVLPEPVTPSSTCSLSPRFTPSASFSIACG